MRLKLHRAPDMTTPPATDSEGSLEQQYQALRTQLQRLGNAPVPDQVAIDCTIDALNKTSAAYREASTGIEGNNPDDT